MAHGACASSLGKDALVTFSLRVLLQEEDSVTAGWFNILFTVFMP